MLPGMELMGCQDLAVPMEVMQHVVRVESSYNPYAIGVVGGHLVRQPKTLPEALATVRMLEDKGYNFSLGLAQVNRYNLDKYGLDSYRKAFQPCANLQAGARILAECYSRSGDSWGKSFSCYYSGDFSTGFRHGYVQKIYASMRSAGEAAAAEPADAAIEVVGKPSRRGVEVSRHPEYSISMPAPQSAAPPTPAQMAAQSSSRLAAALAPQPSRILPASADVHSAKPPSPSLAPVAPSMHQSVVAQTPHQSQPVQLSALQPGAAAAAAAEDTGDSAFVF